MKIKILLVVLMSLFVTLMFANLSYDIDVPSPVLRGDVIDTHLPKVMVPGDPMLPFKALQILLPQGEVLGELEVNFSAENHIDNVELDYAKEPTPISSGLDAGTTIPGEVYSRNAYYPVEAFEVLGVQRKNGFDLLLVNVYPYRYNPQTKSLIWSNSFSVKITTTFDVDHDYQQNLFLNNSERVKRALSKLVINPDLIESYTKSHTRTDFQLPDISTPNQMIIISSQNREELFSDYIDWKEEKGISTGFFSTADIYETYAGIDNQERIRNFIIDAYQTYAQTDTPLEYVILGGDDRVIPIRGMYGRVGNYVDFNMPSDLYYSNLDGNWDANGNGTYGEIDDDVDWFADVAIGRIPAFSDSEFQNFFRKNYYYVDNNTYSNDIAFMMGENLDNRPTWGGDYKDEIIPLIPQEFHIDTLYERDETFSRDAVVNTINAGLGIINHIGHANYNYVFGLTNTRIAGLRNTEFGFAYTQGCYPAAFDNATSQESGCVGQNLVTASGGLFAFIGNTRYGWYFPGSTNGPSQQFDITFFEGLFQEDIRELGHNMSYSKERLVNEAISFEVMRWIYYQLILFGDPSIAVKSPRGTYPYLKPAEIVFDDTQGDNDGMVNPGETVHIYVRLENLPNWSNAYNVSAVLSTDNDNFTLINDTVSYGHITYGTTGSNEETPFVIEIDVNTPYREYDFNLLVSAEGSDESEFSRLYKFKMPVTLIQQNWPWNSNYPISASPLFLNLDGDDETAELIVADVFGNVNIIDFDAVEAQEQLTQNESIWRSFAIGDVNNNGSKEIVFNSRRKRIIAISAEGDTLFSFNDTEEQILTSVIADLNLSGTKEIIAYGLDKKLYVVDNEGELLPGFPLSLSENSSADIAVADLNNDGNQEIIIGTLAGTLYAVKYDGTILDGFPVDLGAGVTTAPTVLNNKNIAVGTVQNRVLLISGEGRIVMNTQVAGRISSEIIAADFNNSGSLHLGFVTSNGRAYIMGQDGTIPEGWPINTGQTFLYPPLAVDMNNNDYVDFICYSNQGNVFGFDYQGKMLDSFPVPLNESITAPAMIADIDGDGDWDIVLVTTTGVTVVDYKLTKGSKVHWANYRNNEARTGFWGDEPTTDVDFDYPDIFVTKLKQNYPNPFNPETRIDFSLAEEGLVSLEIFNIKGQRVTTLINDLLPSGNHSIVWNAAERDNNASGIYFFRLKTKNETLIRKMMLLK